MGDKAWKAFERRIAKLVGGERRGADYARCRDRDGAIAGNDDVIHDKYSIECKLLSKPSFSHLFKACTQAEANAKQGKIPIAIVKKKHNLDKDALVLMRLEEFLKHYLGKEESV